MEEMYDPEIIKMYLSGHASEMRPMVNLMAQVFAILIGGIILWRISSIFGKKSRNRRKKIFSDSRFDSWKK